MITYKHGIHGNVTWHVKNVIYVVFSNARKAGLNWSLEIVFSNYTSFATYNFYQRSSAVQKARNKVNLEKIVICECEGFTNTMNTMCMFDGWYVSISLSYFYFIIYLFLCNFIEKSHCYYSTVHVSFIILYVVHDRGRIHRHRRKFRQWEETNAIMNSDSCRFVYCCMNIINNTSISNESCHYEQMLLMKCVVNTTRIFKCQILPLCLQGTHNDFFSNVMYTS